MQPRRGLVCVPIFFFGRLYNTHFMGTKSNIWWQHYEIWIWILMKEEAWLNVWFRCCHLFYLELIACVVFMDFIWCYIKRNFVEIFKENHFAYDPKSITIPIIHVRHVRIYCTFYVYSIGRSRPFCFFQTYCRRTMALDLLWFAAKC